MSKIGKALVFFTIWFAAIACAAKKVVITEPPTPARSHVVILIDTSRSMVDSDPNRWRIEAAKLIIDRCIPDTVLSIVAFNDLAYPIIQGERVGGADKRNEIKKALDRVVSSEGTNVSEALKAGYDILTASKIKAGTRAAILITDAQSSELQKVQGKELYVSQNIPLVTIALPKFSDEESLYDLANGTGGFYFKANKAADLPGLVDLAWSRLNAEGTIIYEKGYLEADSSRDHRFIVDRTFKNLIVRLIWQGRGNRFRLDLQSPDQGPNLLEGKDFNPILEGRTYKVYSFGNLKSFGEYAAIVKASDVRGQTEHIANQGETLSQIATRYGVALQDLTRVNPGLPSTGEVRPGETVFVPTDPGDDYTLIIGGETPLRFNPFALPARPTTGLVGPNSGLSFPVQVGEDNAAQEIINLKSKVFLPDIQTNAMEVPAANTPGKASMIRYPASAREPLEHPGTYTFQLQAFGQRFDGEKFQRTEMLAVYVPGQDRTVMVNPPAAAPANASPKGSNEGSAPAPPISMTPVQVGSDTTKQVKAVTTPPPAPPVKNVAEPPKATPPKTEAVSAGPRVAAIGFINWMSGKMISISPDRSKVKERMSVLFFESADGTGRPAAKGVISRVYSDHSIVELNDSTQSVNLKSTMKAYVYEQ